MIPNLPTKTLNGVEFTVFKGVNDCELYLINEPHEWKAFYALLKQQELVAIDTETTGFKWMKSDKLVGISVGWNNTHAYIPIRHEFSELAGDPPPQLKIIDIFYDLQSYFDDPKNTLLLWNLNFDRHFLSKEGFEFTNCKAIDGMVLWTLYDEEAPKKLKIVSSGWKDDLGRIHQGIVDPKAAVKEKEIDLWRAKEAKVRKEQFRKLVMAKADELESAIEHQDKTRNELKKWIAEVMFNNHIYASAKKADIHYGIVPVPLMCEYAALDTYLTYKIYEFCVKNITWTAKLKALFNNEIKTTEILYNAEKEGVKIKRQYLEQTGESLDKQIKSLHYMIQQDLGDINLSSTQQLGEALLKAGVKLDKLTDKGKYQVDKSVLVKLKEKHSIIKDILELRRLSKLRETFVNGILEGITDEDTLHCSLNQNVVTGRMSSRAPNLQNLPAKDKTIRKAFTIPSDEYVYILVDYSQIELRLTAHYSQDPLLLDSYAKNQDVHTRTLCELEGIDYNFAIDVLANDKHPLFHEYESSRTHKKRVSFGIIYGVTGVGLSEQLDKPAMYSDITHPQYTPISDKQWIAMCDGYIDEYLNRYIGVKRFINQASRLVAKEHQVTNYFGRVRHLPHANACKIHGDKKWYWLEKKAQRQGVNSIVQSTAADLFKIAAVRVSDILKGTKSKLVLFVHDELHIYLHKDELHLLGKIKHAMEDWNFSVPIVADFSWSTSSWGEKKKIEVK